MLAGFSVMVSSGITLVVRHLFLLLVRSMISYPTTDILPSLCRD
jgi:hypothetical protein